MAIVRVLTKKGEFINHDVVETVILIWAHICFLKNIDPNNVPCESETPLNREFLLLTDKKTNAPYVIQKRYICDILESDENV